MEKQRFKKLENISKEVITNLIFEELPDEENMFWIISVSKVVISPDLSYLDVWVSSMKNWDMLPKALAKLKAIPWKYYKIVWIRKLPKIRYRHDKEWETALDVCLKINSVTK